jgi:hypothetical protein
LTGKPREFTFQLPQVDAELEFVLINSSDFGFGIPELPYVAGRDLVGTVIRGPQKKNARIKVGDVV